MTETTPDSAGRATEARTPSSDNQTAPDARHDSEQLRRHLRVYEAVLSGISDFAYSFDARGRFTYINAALLNLWGLPLEQAVGKDFFELNYPPDLAARLQSQIQHVFTTGERVTDETVYISPSGQRGYYEYIFTPVQSPDGKVELVAGSTRDITSRKQTEEHLREARDAAEAANRSKDRFLAMLSHELRTPLSPVVMTVAAMEMHPDLPADLREDVAMIRRNIDLETKLIDDLLDLSRVVSGKLRLQMAGMSVHEVLRHTFEVCLSDLNAKRLSVDFEWGATNDQVHGDAARLQQVFWNLLKNAIKFSTEGSKIRLGTADTGNGRVRIQIADSGAGIPTAMLPRIFDAFEQGDVRTTRELGGLGLGLAISKAVIDMHGGSILAESDGIGKGATFIVELQAAAQAAKTDQTHASAKTTKQAGESISILLAEDHPDTAKMLARLLNGAGYQTQVAHSVASALEMAAKHRFDIVISDIGLPDASGYDLMRNLRQMHGMKGIALSGYGMEEDMQRGREAGFDDHVVKPTNFNALDAAIRRVLGTRS